MASSGERLPPATQAVCRWLERPIVRELFERGHAAALLPYDPVRDEIVLVEQFRIGAMETSATPGCWSWWPASSMKGRPPRQWCGAKWKSRQGSRWDAAVTRHQLSGEPGWQHRAHRGVRGRGGCQSGQGDPRSGGRGRHPGPRGEPRATAWLKGRIDNAASVIALQWLALNHGELRARWLAGRWVTLFRPGQVPVSDWNTVQWVHLPGPDWGAATCHWSRADEALCA